MSELKSLILSVLFGTLVIGVSIILPRIVKSIALLKKHIPETALSVSQGILVAYALIFGVIIPMSTAIATWLR